MRKVLIILLLIIANYTPVAASDSNIDQMGEVIEEISLLNLLRGIYLTQEQAEKLSKMAVEAEKIRNEGIEKVKKLNSLPKLEKLRDELFTALAEDPPAVRKEVVDLDNEAHRITGEVLHSIAKLEDEVKVILAPGQQKLFWEFVPCIVPELDLESPVRTGQAAASSRLMPAVELIRKTDEQTWRKHGQAYLDHILKVIEQDVGKMTSDAREDLRRRLVKQAWKIRQMKEADFQIHRSQLAEEILLINREKTYRSGFRLTGKVARFFLSPAAARVLPRWVETHFGKKTGVLENEETPESEIKEEAPLQKGQIEKPVVDGFWEKDVPVSLARLSETPYFDRIFHAYGKPYSIRFFDEEEKYVDFFRLIEEAGVILTREKEMTFYNLTQGEP